MLPSGRAELTGGEPNAGEPNRRVRHRTRGLARARPPAL